MTNEMGLLRSSVAVRQCDPHIEDFGVAYANRDNVGLKVQHFSCKHEGSGNTKYVCKRLNGQQFFDKDVPHEDIERPFSINVCGFEGFWKVSRVNFCHNHIKHAGFSSLPVTEGTIARPVKDKRNTTHSVKELTRLIEMEMPPVYE
ncbi:hypothetical protein PF005_g3707 [Phytophthora fragariae]|uniref:Uncharacterized protein n=1 Tax=Phytophthora fragariae TaxID=53985 RepID=A0A6A3Z3H5_9STRA|nr:hypothetical protein PF005_g3707 [Phytophthora fragariae]KAE9249733.1 hypothetical protein PF002_g5143 [Phytophthora fragariae]